MSDKAKAPTEAGLAAIKARAEKATPGPWRTSPQLGYVIPSDVGADYKVAQVGGSRGSRGNPGQIARDDPFWQADTLFIAHARSDVPALLAAVEERDHLIWVMSQDQEVYLRGREDGRRDRLMEVVWLLTGWADEAGDKSPHYAALNMAAYKLLRADPVESLPPPLPPDRARAEAGRLRAALRHLLDDFSEDAVKAAREALGEET